MKTRPDSTGANPAGLPGGSFGFPLRPALRPTHESRRLARRIVRFPGKTAYYYVRGEQEDGELVWASPMWITYQPE